MSDITRQKTIDYLYYLKTHYPKNLIIPEYIDYAISSLETDEAYDLEYELTKNDLGVDVHDNNVGNIDCISRADAIGSIAVECSAEKLDIDYAKFLMLRRAIKALPTVTPIRPKGHWICDGKGRSFADYHCSECGLKLALCGQDIKQRQDSGYSLFCGGCGADMREVVEE